MHGQHVKMSGHEQKFCYP